VVSRRQLLERGWSKEEIDWRVRNGRLHRLHAGVRHVSEVPADERAVEEGVPVTSVPRTIFDLAASEDVDAVVSMLREAEYRNLWDRLSLWDLLARYPRKRGSRKVRVALDRLKEEP
jgi:hypothetical protein